MKHTSYRQNDYNFGQKMLTLRSAIGLTQAALAESLGVSRQSVVEWEAGNKYPKASHLKALITLAIQHQALPKSHEANEIRELWKASQQKVLLDEAWLTQILIPRSDEQIPTNKSPVSVIESRFHWKDAHTIDAFYGRQWELNLLSTWIIEEQCRIITLLGLGGIGKSTLAIHVMHQLAENFEVVIWRSLRDLPTCDALLADLLQILAPQMLGEMAETFEQRMALLMEQLRASRILLVLDNVESVFEASEISGRVRAGYEGFGRFLQRAAETYHQGSILLTSRQKPDDLLPHEGTHTAVRTLRLAALDAKACEELLAEREVTGSPAEYKQLVEAYAGNPLALKIVAQTISDLFGGDIGPFLKQGGVVFGGVHELLHAQYIRLTSLERRIVFWLAIMREPLTVSQLQSLFVAPLPPVKVLETINKLHRHSLIERGQISGSFTLQSVVLEYLTEQLIAEASDEIQRGEFSVLIQHGLEQSQVKEYVRQAQTRLLVRSLSQQLQSMELANLETYVEMLLNRLREMPINTQGYGPANLVVLLRLLRGHLRGIDLSGLALRGVNFQGVQMQDTRLSRAVMQNCDFTETFDGINGLTISANGQYWAASSNSGEVRLWEATNHTLYRIWSNTVDVVYRISLNPDGKKLAGGTHDGVLKVWDTASGVLLWTSHWPESVSLIYRIGFSPKGNILFCMGNDFILRILDAGTGVQLQTISHPNPVSFVVWSPDGQLLAIGDRGGLIRILGISLGKDTETWECVQEILGHQQLVTGLSFSPDGKVLASSSADGTGKLWDVSSGELIEVIRGHVSHARFSPDGRFLCIIGRENSASLWEVESRSFRTALQGHEAGINNLVFAPDGNTLLTASRDGMIRIWDVKSGECLYVILGYTLALSDVGWSPDGQQLMSGGTDQIVTVYSVNHTAEPCLLYGHSAAIFSVSWHPSGKWLASVQRDNIRLWDAASGECLRVLRFSDTRHHLFYYAEWSPDGQCLAVSTPWHGVVTWNIETQQFHLSHEDFPTLIGGRVAWNFDGTQILSGGHNRVVYIWNVEGQVLREFAGHEAQLMGVAWSPNNKQIASISTREIIIWDVETGERLSVIEEVSNKFSEIIWNIDGHIITGSSDGRLQWWDVQTGKCIFTHHAHQGSIQGLRKNPDQTILASCGSDGAIKIWDLHTREYLQTVRRDRPYERLDITGVQGLTEAQKMNLRALGAIEGFLG